MAKTRARLTDDNDPLSSTESVFASLEQSSKLASQQVSNTTIQEVKKSTIRKSTFQLSEEVLKQLDRYHLQLQLDLGKTDAPYKEVIVEEAIAQFLVNADHNNLNSLLTRQKTR
jgi:hypothetical protein